MVKYRQGIAIIDTADPILFRFPKRADDGDEVVAPRRSLSSAPYLTEAVAAMNEIREAEEQLKPPPAVTPPEQTQAPSSESRDVEASVPTSNETTKPIKARAGSGRIQVRDIEEKRDQKVLPFVKDKDEMEQTEDDETCVA